MSPDDEIHLDGAVEFDHVDRHHFSNLGLIYILYFFSIDGGTQHLRNRWRGRVSGRGRFIFLLHQRKQKKNMNLMFSFSRYGQGCCKLLTL